MTNKPNTWRGHFNNGVTRIRWPGWSGSLRLRLVGERLVAEPEDEKGRRITVHRENYEPWAERKDWLPVEDIVSNLEKDGV